MRTDRTIPNNKPDIIICHNKRSNIILIDVAIPGDRKYGQKRSGEHFKVKGPHNRNSAHVECESKSDTGNSRGDWNQFSITQTIPEQHTRKAQN